MGCLKASFACGEYLEASCVEIKNNPRWHNFLASPCHNANSPQSDMQQVKVPRPPKLIYVIWEVFLVFHQFRFCNFPSKAAQKQVFVWRRKMRAQIYGKMMLCSLCRIFIVKSEWKEKQFVRGFVIKSRVEARRGTIYRRTFVIRMDFLCLLNIFSVLHAAALPLALVGDVTALLFLITNRFSNPKNCQRLCHDKVSLHSQCTRAEHAGTGEALSVLIWCALWKRLACHGNWKKPPLKALTLRSSAPR